jgi:anti-sigma-K factor RskA
MNETEFAELAAGHALSALSASDRHAFEAALAAHPEWAHYVRTDVDTVALLSDTIGTVAPPPAIRAELLARIARTTQTTDAAPDVPAPGAPASGPAAPGASSSVVDSATAGGRGMRRWFTLAASFVAILVLGFGAVVVGQQLTRPAAVVALEQIENAADAESATIELADGGEATAHWSESLGEAVFVSEGLPALASDETFELWFVRDEGAISAGTFATDDGTATALLAGEYEPGDVIAVTVEPAGGAPEGVPTSDPIVAITTT